MDRAFKVIGAIALSVSAGALLGMTTPTDMKLAPDPAWRLAARAAIASQPIQLSQAAVVYSSMPEDLSTDVGYGSPAAYQAFYVDAPVRTEYTSAPDYAARPLDEQEPAHIAADAAALAAREVRDQAVIAPEPVRLASAKEVDMPDQTTNPEFDPVFDTTGDAPAMDAGGEDE